MKDFSNKTFSDAKIKRMSRSTMFIILFSLFIFVLGITAGVTYSAFQNTAQSNGTLSFAINGHQGTLDLSNTKVANYNSTDLTLVFTLASDTGYNNPTITNISMGGSNLTKESTNFKNGSNIIATYSSSTLTIYRAEVTGALIITGSSTVQTYTISYNSNGGSGTMADTTANYNSFANLRANAFTRTGYTFAGWATSSGGQVIYHDEATIPSIGTTTLYAKWVANKYLINFDDQGADIKGTIAVNATYGSTIPGITIPVRTGYTFNGYYTAINGGGTQYYTASGTSAITYSQTSDITLYAKWTVATYTVTYNATTNGGATSATDATVNHGSTADLSKAASKSSWTFIGWNTNQNATTGLSAYTVTANTTLYAIFSRILTISYNNNGTSNIVSTIIYNTATSGTSSSNLPAVAGKSGWAVYGWSNSTTANNSRVDTNTSAHAITITTSNTGSTYYATYSRTLTLSYNANGGNSTPASQTTTQYYNSAGNTSSYSFTLSGAISRNQDNYNTYSFNSWAQGSAGGPSYNAGAAASISTDTVFYAKWDSAIRYYTISGMSTTVTCEYGAVYTIVFAGNIGPQQFPVFYLNDANGNRVLTIWQPGYTIGVYLNGERVCGTSGPQSAQFTVTRDCTITTAEE